MKFSKLKSAGLAALSFGLAVISTGEGSDNVANIMWALFAVYATLPYLFENKSEK